jgi:hypothetical protein
MCTFHTLSSFSLFLYFLLFFLYASPPWIVGFLFFLGEGGWCRYATLCCFVHSLRSFSCVVVLFLSHFPFCSWFVALFHLLPHRVVFVTWSRLTANIIESSYRKRNSMQPPKIKHGDKFPSNEIVRVANWRRSDGRPCNTWFIRTAYEILVGKRKTMRDLGIKGIQGHDNIRWRPHVISVMVAEKPRNFLTKWATVSFWRAPSWTVVSPHATLAPFTRLSTSDHLLARTLQSAMSERIWTAFRGRPKGSSWHLRTGGSCRGSERAYRKPNCDIMCHCTE